MLILPASAQQLFYVEYGESHGLDQTNINVLVQDLNGYLWVGTDSGLYKFDGYTFQEILFSNINEGKTVFDLAVDKKKQLWIASESGLTAFNGSTFNFLGLHNDEPSTASVPAKALFAGNGIYWSDGHGNIHLVRDKKLTKITEHSIKVIDWVEDAEKSIWILSDTHELYILEETRISGPYTLENELDGGLRFLGLRKAANGEVQLVTSGGILALSFDPEIGKVLSLWHFRYDTIREFFTSSRDQHWLLDDKSLLRISGGDTSRIRIPVKHDQKVLFFEDIENNIWLSVSGSGLYKIQGDAITRLDIREPGNYAPTAYEIRNDEIWISYFGAGVKVIRKEEAKMEEVKGLISNYVRDMIYHDQETWFITARGVSRMKDNRLYHYSSADGLPHNYCYKAITDASGNLLVATEQGLAIFENDGFSAVGPADGREPGRIKDLYLTSRGSVLLIGENEVNMYQDGEIGSFIGNGFSGKEVLNTVTEDQFGNLWIGSDMNGLFFFDPETSSLRNVSRELVLPFSRVKVLVPHGERKLVIGTEKGIMLAEINGEGEITGFYPCGMEMGYPDFEVNQHAYAKSGDKIYLGTSMGTVIFHPESLQLNPGNGPVVNITGFDISFKETDWTKTSQLLDPWFQIPEEPLLTHDQNDLLFNYKGISLYSSDLLWYRYRLENYDNTWSEPSQNTSAIYANLTPGHYEFQVQSSYDGFNWADHTTSYALIIAPPFWSTWWFYVIVISFVLAGFILVNNYRIKIKINQLIAIEKLKKEEYSRIQKKVAMDFHDEVGNHLTSISMLVELIKSNEWEVEDELKELLEKIDDESKNLFRGTMDFIWSIDPANDNLKAVYQNIRDYGIDLFENSPIRFQAQNGKVDMQNVKLPAGFARHIVLIFKEGLNNVLKHAGCRNVHFLIDINEQNIEIKLQDDGRGFREKDLPYFEGIKKMKYRGAKIKSELILNSDEDKGTEIILKARI